MFYDAAEPRGRVAAKAVQRIVDWICNGSVDEVLVGMVDSNMIDRKQLRMLLDRLDERKTGRRWMLEIIAEWALRSIALGSAPWLGMKLMRECPVTTFLK